MDSVTLTLVFALLAAGVVLLTLAGMRFAARYTRAHSPLLAAFSAGLLLTIAVLHLIPESLAGSPIAVWMIGGGLVLGLVLRRAAGLFTPDRESAAALAPVLAIALHASFDGLTYDRLRLGLVLRPRGWRRPAPAQAGRCRRVLHPVAACRGQRWPSRALVLPRRGRLHSAVCRGYRPVCRRAVACTGRRPAGRRRAC